MKEQQDLFEPTALENKQDKPSASADKAETSQNVASSASKFGRVSLTMWPVLGATGLLMLVVIALTALSIGQNESTTIKLLTGEGAALVQAVENTMRIAIRERRPLQLQRFLQEMVGGDVRFIAIVLPDGTILTHSTPERLGEILEIDNQEASKALLQNISETDEDEQVHWFMANVEGARSFVVYRPFMMPLKRKDRDANASNAQRPKNNRIFLGNERERNMPRVPPPEFSRKPQGNTEEALRFRNKTVQSKRVRTQPLIFLGLDIEPLERSQVLSRMQLWALAGGGVLVGMALLLSLYYAQRAQESRQKQHVAEGQVRQLEAEVAHKEKMAAIGNLAAGVAHEIRNPLSSIKGYATYFGQRFAEGSEDRQAAHVMVREVDRLNRVITDLIGLSRPTDIQAVPTDMALVVEHTMRLVQQDAAKNGVQLHVRQSRRPLPKVLVDVDRFGQALLNICLNAIEAMPKGGHLYLIMYARNKYELTLEIKDTGQGIAKEHLAHIFDPYFTTKGHGTGLGLATVHKILEAHGANISVTSVTAAQASQKKHILSKAEKSLSQKQTGTIFKILIPLAPTGDRT